LGNIGYDRNDERIVTECIKTIITNIWEKQKYMGETIINVHIPIVKKQKTDKTDYALF
jgi:hypothetical protein